MTVQPVSCLTLSQLRDRAGLSLPQVADELRISIETLQAWESLEKIPRLELWQIVKLTRLYGVSVEELEMANRSR